MKYVNQRNSYRRIGVLFIVALAIGAIFSSAASALTPTVSVKPKVVKSGGTFTFKVKWDGIPGKGTYKLRAERIAKSAGKGVFGCIKKATVKSTTTDSTKKTVNLKLKRKFCPGTYNGTVTFTPSDTVYEPFGELKTVILGSSKFKVKKKK